MPRTDYYDLTDLLNIKTEIEGLKEKEKERYNKKEAFLYLKETIKSLVEKNYSVDEISRLLANHQFSIAPTTLKKWLGERDRTKSKTTTLKPVKPNTPQTKNTETKEPGTSFLDSSSGHEIPEPVEEKNTSPVEQPTTVKEEQINSAAHFIIKKDTAL